MPARKKPVEVVDGIKIEPVPITLGDTVKIKYTGKLTKNGAKKIYLHAGFGYGAWEKISDIPMRKDKNGNWSASVDIDDPSRFNFCFRDDENNWDNNEGRNWTFEVHNGDLIEH